MAVAALALFSRRDRYAGLLSCHHLECSQRLGLILFPGRATASESRHFSLHTLMGSVLVLLTPVGFVAVVRTLFARGSKPDVSWRADRRTAFIAIYTLVPLSAFVAFSLFHEVKLNWTGPIWLAILPALAGDWWRRSRLDLRQI